ncbi:MAG: methyltransferase domain-containing protein [Gammaproteobacteria bacterium]|nr:methyltransferase domain-containing protein [Gammaproteobacteria bacterium]
MKDTRSSIAKKYSEAVSDYSSGVVRQTGAAKFASYQPEELNHIPKDAIENSFGCGNPLAFTDVKPGQSVLDLGCGAGLDLIIAAEKTGDTGRVVGVDMTDAMLDKARKNIAESGLKNIELRKGVIENLPVESDSVDWVISNCVINLSAEKNSVFFEVNRVLRPGGTMLVSDIVAEKLPWWVRYSGALNAACVAGAISESEYLHGLKEAGMINCDIVGRQYYSARQMAAVIVNTMPLFIQKMGCCGNSFVILLLNRLLRPLANKLWSVRVTAMKASSIK